MSTYNSGLSPVTSFFFGRDDTLYGPFQHPHKATQALHELVAEHRLCAVITGRKSSPPAPALPASYGVAVALCGRESRLAHKLRLIVALQPLRMQAWPYAGPIALKKGDEWHVIDAWAYLGSTRWKPMRGAGAIAQAAL